MLSTWQDRIVSDPLILRGKPCFRQTRVPVGLILGYLAARKSNAAILDEFPDLKDEDLSAALEYARDLADFDAVTNP